MKLEPVRDRTKKNLKPNVIQGKLERTTGHKQLHLHDGSATPPPPSLFIRIYFLKAADTQWHKHICQTITCQLLK